MHGFFISFPKRELGTSILLDIRLKIITFLGLINSLEVTFLLEVTVFLTRVTDLEAFFLKSLISDPCIDSTYINGTYNKAVFDKNACIRSFYDIKHLEMYLQSFQIFEARSARLEI